MALTTTKLPLELLASGKVRDVYTLPTTPQTILFVATDRVSCYDVVLANGIPNKGRILTLLSAHWFKVLSEKIPHLQTHFLGLELPPDVEGKEVREMYEGRAMRVKKLEVLPIESIVRGYISGSAWESYKKTGKVHGVVMPEGLKESDKLEKPMWTPSTKAPAGEKDENISEEQAKEIIGEDYAAQVKKLSLELYEAARDYAAPKGILLADTKFEFALDRSTTPPTVVLVDEVLTPDSSRFWLAKDYAPGRPQESLDKQFLRDWLVRSGLKGVEGVEIPADVIEKSLERYESAFEMVVGKGWRDF